jgi:hypothetical protein
MLLLPVPQELRQLQQLPLPDRPHWGAHTQMYLDSILPMYQGLVDEVSQVPVMLGYRTSGSQRRRQRAVGLPCERAHLCEFWMGCHALLQRPLP